MNACLGGAWSTQSGSSFTVVVATSTKKNCSTSRAPPLGGLSTKVLGVLSNAFDHHPQLSYIISCDSLEVYFLSQIYPKPPSGVGRMLAAEGNNVWMDLGWTLQWHLAWMQQCQARWGLDKATENFYHHEFIMRKICETMILTAELTWNYILYGFAFCLEGIWDVDACCSSLQFNSFSQAEQDKVTRPRIFSEKVTKVGMLHLNTFAAQDGSDFREPPNEVPTSLRQRRPPQRSTAENEARREVAGGRRIIYTSKSCILYGLVPWIHGISLKFWLRLLVKIILTWNHTRTISKDGSLTK